MHRTPSKFIRVTRYKQFKTSNIKAMHQSTSLGTMHIELRMATMLSKQVHKDRRWRLNIMVEERPFVKGSRDSSLIKSFQKLWYLIAFSSHCPYHKHLEVIKVKVNKLWCTCLTKYKLEISCPLNTRTAPHSTQVQSPVSSCHRKYMCIIENRQRGTPCPMIRQNPHIKMTRQADNEHLSNLLIYHGNMVFFLSFLFS